MGYEGNNSSCVLSAIFHKTVGKKVKKKIQSKHTQEESALMSSSICKEEKYFLFMAWDFSLL